MSFRKVLSYSVLLVACSTIAFLGCNNSSSSSSASAVRSYNGTASVGDFLTISIDSTTQTITYDNLTNGETGTVPYTVNADGTYTITDPQGNLLAGYELPGFAFLVEAAKAGPSQNTPALQRLQFRWQKLQLHPVPHRCRRRRDRQRLHRRPGRYHSRRLFSHGAHLGQ
jgi:type 1 glutamine amidotransferase